MLAAELTQLALWENFDVIVGSAAAALTGLMFVVVTLRAGLHLDTTGETISAFGTPTVVHFCAALGIAATLSAPWQMLAQASVLLVLAGICGLAYLVIVIRRVKDQGNYQPVFEDWLWHAMLPSVAYTAVTVAAFVLPRNPAPALFVTGGVMMLLLFIGIHNAWDAVAYLVAQEAPKQDGPEK